MYASLCVQALIANILQIVIVMAANAWIIALRFNYMCFVFTNTCETQVAQFAYKQCTRTVNYDK